MALRPKRFLSLLALIIFSTALTGFAQQNFKVDDPQHACASATSQMELNECAGEQYHKADTRLNAIYRKALEIMQKNLSDAQEEKNLQMIKYDQEGIDKLRAAERAWIQYRDLHCEAARQQYEGGSMSPMIWGFCMAQTTLDRVREVKFAYEDGDRKLE